MTLIGLLFKQNNTNENWAISRKNISKHTCSSFYSICLLIQRVAEFYQIQQQNMSGDISLNLFVASVYLGIWSFGLKPGFFGSTQAWALTFVPQLL